MEKSQYRVSDLVYGMGWMSVIMLIVVIGVLFGQAAKVLQTDLADYKIDNFSSEKVVSQPIDSALPQPTAVSIIFGGDMMLGRYVETLMNKNGLNYPFEKLKPFIEPYDLAVANLEGPITLQHSQTPDYTTSFSFKTEVATVLKNAGFDVVSLANNHTADKGLPNLQNTRDVLNGVGILEFGHPLEVQADAVKVKEIGGLKTVWIGFHDATVSLDVEAAKKLVAEWQTKMPDATIIVNIHWGAEYIKIANAKQRDLGRVLVDAGADLIIGHHPHVVQDFEVYNGVPIFYSLGNLVFDQYFSADTQLGLMVSVKLMGPSNMELGLWPVSVAKSQPRVLVDAERTAWLENYALSLSEDLRETAKNGSIIVGGL